MKPQGPVLVLPTGAGLAFSPPLPRYAEYDDAPVERVVSTSCHKSLPAISRALNLIALISLVLNLLAAVFKSKSRLEAENAALRRQLMVLQRKVRARVRFKQRPLVLCPALSLVPVDPRGSADSRRWYADIGQDFAATGGGSHEQEDRVGRSTR
jgi:hypothetical protein